MSVMSHSMARDTVPPAVAAPAMLAARDYLSWSSIGLYLTCPLRYYFRYVVGLPEATISATLLFGTAVHQALEHHFNQLLAGHESPCLEELLGEYDRAWQDVDPYTVQFGKDDLEGLAELARRMLSVFQASPLAQPAGQILGVEETMRGALIAGCPDVLGRIDLLVETDAALVVTDFKTARCRWSADQVEDAGGQLLLYGELARSLVPGKPLKLQFAVLTKTKEPALELYEVAADRRQVTRTQEIVARTWRAIEAGHFYPAPSAMNCPGCPFREPCRQWPG